MTRNDYLEGGTFRCKTGCGWLYVTVNFQDGKPIEIMTRLGKSGVCAASQLEAIGRIVNVAISHGAQMEEIIKNLDGIRCQTPSGDILSCADGIAKKLKQAMETNRNKDDARILPTVS